MAVEQAIRPAGRHGNRLPLSFAQRLLWFMDQLTSSLPIFNVGLAARLHGELDVDALGRALDRIAERHEILRTTYESEGGVPWQVVGEPRGVELTPVDLGRLDAGAREREVARLVEEESQRPFDLQRGPVFRRGLLRCGAEEHVLLLTVHHIALDGWSVRLLIQEMVELYGAQLEGREPRLRPLPIQFGDYAAWQREWLHGEVLEEHLDYWKEQLRGLPTLELPLDWPRPATPTYRGESMIGLLPADLMEEVRQLARRSRASVFMVLLAAFQALLQRYTGQDDLVVGSGMAGRMHEEVDNLIGCFVTVAVLRTDLSGDPTFEELLERVKDVVLGATMYQELPFERLLDELHTPREVGRNPLVQVVFAAQTGGIEWIDMPGLRVEPLHVASAPLPLGTSRLDLTISVSERRSGEADVWLEYSTELFDRGRIELLLSHYERLLSQLVARPGVRLSELEPVGERERRCLLEEWQGPAVAYPKERCIHQLFEEQARARPDAVAVVCGDERVTYGELDRRANRLAHHLRRLGVGPDVKVGICLERSMEMVESLLAILKAGGAYLPLDPEYPAERLGLMLRRARADVALTKTQWQARLPAGLVRHVVRLDVDRERWSGEAETSPEVAVSAEHLACVFFTSGSQGEPKGIESPHRATVRTFFGTDYMEYGPWLVVPQMAPMAWDGLTLELWPPLLHGGTSVLLQERVATAATLRELIAREGVNTMLLPAALLNAVVDQDADALRGVRQLLTGGDTASPRHVRLVKERLGAARVVNGYGPAESTVYASCYEVPDGLPEGRSVPIGRPIANTQVYVLGPGLRPVPTGVVGEMHLGGDGLARGYMGRPDLTAERFVPDPFGPEGGRLYRSGDLARWRVDGTLEFIGRADEQVKILGHRVEPGEVETVLGTHPDVREAVVEARPDGGGQKRLVAYVVPAGERGREAEYRRYLKDRLPEYLVPSAFVSLDAMPLTPNGKVDRSALPEPESTRPDLEVEYVLPRGAVQQELARAVFGDLLGLQRVGAGDSFFELGGNSLQVMQVVARVRERFGVELDLRELYRAPTVAALAALIEAGAPTRPVADDNPAEEELDRLLEGA